jgi:hypothetical protein
MGIALAAILAVAWWLVHTAPAPPPARTAPDGLLTVLVRTANDEPLATTDVQVEGLLAMSVPVTTGPDGRFTWAVGDATKPVDLVVTVVRRDAAGGAPPTMRGVARGVLAASGETVVVVRPLPTDRKLSFVVRSPSDAPARGATVLLTTAAGALRTAVVDDGGRAAFAGLTSETWSGSVDAPATSADWLSQRIEPLVPDGREVAVRFRVGVPVEGVVLGSDGKAATAAQVQVVVAGTPSPAPARPTPGVPGGFRILVDPETPRPVTVRAVQGREEGESKVERLPATGVTIRLAPPR